MGWFQLVPGRTALEATSRKKKFRLNIATASGIDLEFLGESAGSDL